MPVREYKCRECDVEIELLQKMDEKGPNCSVCGRSMVRVMSHTSFILNGGNWASNGYGLRTKKKVNKE